MINLKDHIVEVGNEEYVPLKVAEAAVAEAYNSTSIDDAVSLIQKAIKDMNDSVNDALKDD